MQFKNAGIATGEPCKVFEEYTKVQSFAQIHNLRSFDEQFLKKVKILNNAP